MIVKIEIVEKNMVVNFRSLPKGTLVRFQGIIAMTSYNGTLIGLATGDTWSSTDFEVEVLPKGSKITIAQE